MKSVPIMSKIRVAHVISDIHLSSGGPSQSVVELLNAMAEDNGIELFLCCVKMKNEENYGTINKKVISKINIVNNIIGFIFPIKIYKILLNLPKVDIIHIHGMWLPIYLITYIYARIHKTKIIFQPRGMLEPWSLSKKMVIKKIALILYQNMIIKNAKTVIATSIEEKNNIESLGYNLNIHIIHNSLNYEVVYENNKNNYSNKKVLFMSRIHEKKGIKLLIEAWSNIDTTNWTLLIAGPNNDNYPIEKIIDNTKKNNIKYLGAVYGEKKYKLMSEVDLFILPSYSENFGNVILEAMMLALPVITTVNTPWREIKDSNAGWWVNSTVEDITNALKEALSSDLKEKGFNSYNLSKKYDLKSISNKLLNLYKSID